MRADIEALHSLLKIKIRNYEFQFKKVPTVEVLSALLHVTLYYKRFFPYYTFNLLCGIGKEGNGVVYGYDAIGSFDILTYGAVGSAGNMCVPVLDSIFEGHNNPNAKPVPDYQVGRKGIIDAMNAACEREIHKGDTMEILSITNKGISLETIPLKID